MKRSWFISLSNPLLILILPPEGGINSFLGILDHSKCFQSLTWGQADMPKRLDVKIAGEATDFQNEESDSLSMWMCLLPVIIYISMWFISALKIASVFQFLKANWNNLFLSALP